MTPREPVDTAEDSTVGVQPGVEHPEQDERTEQLGRPGGVHRRGRWAARLVFIAGLAVAVAAAAATAHGLYEVVRASGGPVFIAALYPLITDGLALVAYSATARLSGGGRRYAWTIVVAAAGLSGLAQATYLAGGVHTAPGWLSAGVGGWPAIAAAIVAHLLYLLGTADDEGPGQGVQHHGEHPVRHPADGVRPQGSAVQPEPVHPVPRDPEHHLRDQELTVQPGGEQSADERVQPRAEHREDEAVGIERHGVQLLSPGDDDGGQRPQSKTNGNGSTARSRATTAAWDHRNRRGQLPSVSELTSLADVSRGTASAVLKHLRAEQNGLQLIQPENDSRNSR